MTDKLAPYAGFDPSERAIGQCTNYGPHRPKQLASAMAKSDWTLRQYRERREAARLNPPHAAQGDFPYFQKGKDR